MEHLVAVVGLGLACAAWIVVQRWIARVDPDQPGVEGSGHGCGHCHHDRGPACGPCPTDPQPPGASC